MVEREFKINGKKVHSAQKSTELLYKIVASTSDLDDLVLDPFVGSGATIYLKLSELLEKRLR
jgi:DNA modification methylase